MQRCRTESLSYLYPVSAVGFGDAVAYVSFPVVVEPADEVRLAKDRRRAGTVW